MVDSGLEVHVLIGTQQRHHFGSTPYHSVSVVDHESVLGRFLKRTAVVENFVLQRGLDFVHFEAPPFTRIRNAKSLAAIHDLRFLDHPLRDSRSTAGLYQHLLLGRQVRSVDAVTALSSWAARDIRSKLGADLPIFELPPVVTRSPFASQSMSRRKVPYVLILGHLEKRKNVATILKAAASDDWPAGVEIVIAGADAGEAGTLRMEASRARCAVEFLGAIDDATKWQLLEGALAVLVPSLVEGFGLVAVEGPLSGAPALVSDRTALVDLASDAYAVVPATNPAAWAQRVALLARDESVRQSLLESQQETAKRFSADAVVQRILQIYQSLVNP